MPSRCHGLELASVNFAGGVERNLWEELNLLGRFVTNPFSRELNQLLRNRDLAPLAQCHISADVFTMDRVVHTHDACGVQVLMFEQRFLDLLRANV